VSDVPDRSARLDPPAGRRLDSWKEIASYLNRSVRTVKRWESLEGLPVRRHQHAHSSSVWANTSELDAWAQTRQRPRLTATPQKETTPVGQSVAIPSRTLTAASLVALSAAIIGLGVVYLALRHVSSSSAPPPVKLAVLPMVNLSGDPREEYISDGLTEEVIAELGALAPTTLSVVAPTSAMRYKHSRKRVDEIARELGVDYVLDGSIRHDKGRIHISARLIDARTQRHVWAEQYARETRDMPNMQTDLVRAIGRAISARLTNTHKALAAVAHHRTQDPEAFRLYARGRYEYNKRTADGFRNAIAHLTAAIERDPASARAYAALADTYALMGSYGMMPMRDSHARGRAAALKALDIDDTVAEAHAAIATITSDFYWDWDEAERRFRRAIELNPSYATAYHWYSFYLGNMGRFDEALAAATKAQELDPLSLVASANVGLAYLRARRHEEAVTSLRHTLAMDADFGYAHLCLGLAYTQIGMIEEAIREFQIAKSLMGVVNADALTAYALARSGRRRDAETILAKLQGNNMTSGAEAYHVAIVFMALNDHDRAFSWLDEAIDRREWFVGMLKVDPLLDPLRSDSRFSRLLKRVGLTTGP
jgi:TolB-like protein/Tfp pilus assembly protein PilF